MICIEELSEKDLQLKTDLEMLVERLKVCCQSHLSHEDDVNLSISSQQEPDTSLYSAALDAIKDSIKTSTSSMTAVPKPLKFLRPHYDELTAVYDSWSAGPVKVGVHS